jgi:phage terminase large subunit-like protein
MPTSFELTPRQQIANGLLGSAARNVLLFGGARSGKTFLICRAILTRAIAAPGSRHAILRFRANAARSSIALDTLPKARMFCYPQVRLHEHRQDGFFELPNGSQIWIAGLDDKERVEKILGQEFATMFFNECSQIPYGSVTLARTRLAQRVPIAGSNKMLREKAYYDCNPPGKGHWSNVEFGDHKDPTSRMALRNPEDFVRMGINPTDNAQNLTPEFIASLENLPEKQRRRFYEGIYVAEIEGALWSYDRLDQVQCTVDELPEMSRIVVSVDPSGARGPEDKRSDEIGIGVAGKGMSDGRAYIMEDLTIRDAPAVWARRAVHAFYKWRADCIIAETNFGGAMVEEAIRTVDPNVPFRAVTASRGKAVRAEPVAALYAEKIDKIRHVIGDGVRTAHTGRLALLEEQLTNFSSAGYTGERSPDRADAMVWAVHELMLQDYGKGEALLELARRDMTAKKDKADTPQPVKKEWAKGSVEYMKQLMGEIGPPT